MSATSAPRPRTSPCSVELFWIPLGAGGASPLVRWSGRAFEAVAARRDHRAPQRLFHTALRVHLHGTTHVVEMTPRWGQPSGDRGVVAQGPVGAKFLGHSRFFQYEIHCWEHGVIPDVSDAVQSPRRMSHDEQHARQVLELAPSFPAATWGRDDLGAGEMWNSNSLTAWLLARSGHRTELLVAPARGRAPGWSAGLVLAARQVAAEAGAEARA